MNDAEYAQTVTDLKRLNNDLCDAIRVWNDAAEVVKEVAAERSAVVAALLDAHDTTFEATT